MELRHELLGFENRPLSVPMRRILSILIFWSAVYASSTAQTLTDYLKIRRFHHIIQSAGVGSLETLMGTRIVEVKGIVKGSFRVGELTSLLLERADGDTLVIEAPSAPVWLSGNEVPARLLVRANRGEQGGLLRAVLLSAAPEGSMLSYDQEQARRSAEKQPHPSGYMRKYTATSRHATRVWNLPASQVSPIYAAFIRKQNRRLSDAEALHIANAVVGFSIYYGVDARLIMAMVMAESGFDPGSTSRTGAMGLGQLMPGTAQGLGVSNAYDTTENLYGTVKLVRSHLDKYRRQTGDDYQSLVLSIAAYNAGSGAVRRAGGVPPYRETQAYVRRVINLFAAFRGQS